MVFSPGFLNHQQNHIEVPSCFFFVVFTLPAVSFFSAKYLPPTPKKMVETSAKNGILTVEHPQYPQKKSRYMNDLRMIKIGPLVKNPSSCAAPSKQPAGKRHQLAFRFRLGILLGLFFLANGGLHSLLGSLARLRFCFLALLGLFSLESKLVLVGSWGCHGQYERSFGMVTTWQNFSYTKKLKKRLCKLLMMSTISY